MKATKNNTKKSKKKVASNTYIGDTIYIYIGNRNMLDLQYNKKLNLLTIVTYSKNAMYSNNASNIAKITASAVKRGMRVITIVK